MIWALLVEPDADARDLITEALSENGYHVSRAGTIAEARVQLGRRRYDAVLSALPLPDGSGAMLADAAREVHPDIATVIIAENGDFATARRILGAGVDGYLVRPLNREQVALTVTAALHRRSERQDARRRGDELRAVVNARASNGTDPAFGELLLRRLARTARFRDEETAAHMQRMSESCAAIAKRLGFSDADCERLRAAALLHDVGKVGVPDVVLQKPGKLNADERRMIECHTEYGHEILTGSGDDLVELAATIALSHHERPDGSGYPRGLSGEEIPLVGRIAAVADVFDALTNDRIYRAAYSIGDAVQTMSEGRGTQFDPEVFDAFLDALNDITEIGARLPDAPEDRAGEGASTAQPTRVLIVEDHEAVGRGLELLLRREGMEIAGTAFNLAGARSLLDRRRPDVVVLDVDLGGENGLELIEDAHNADARVLLYTGRGDPAVLAAAERSSALGVATKAGPPVELVAAVRAVAAGQIYRDPRLTGAPSPVEPKHRLTPREQEVVKLLAQGLNGQEIAETLFLSPQTIRTHIRNAMDRVGARTRTHLIAVAVANDEITIER
ncbi:MAG TPA: HD domain-containing phosphohydrolase [Thermoleophilaceae bacterium]|jgi:putative two-component system response regulator|nr:HD domain-containing phosphohydrolase [Thermoleophilaceae bacterium]